ncbi:hypothetical protein AAVH_36802 [Aphelenchoides avenae]|nr:hypothetical protein AAVH_36802 [Aphelenchus avenae]
MMCKEQSEEPKQLTHLERNMVAVSKLERDRYRNLQKKAKRHGIPANLKRKEMINLLKLHYDQHGLAASSQSTETEPETNTEPGDAHLEAEYVPQESQMEQQPAAGESDEVVQPVLKDADVAMEETDAGSSGDVQSKESATHTEAKEDISSQLSGSLASQQNPGSFKQLRRRTVFIPMCQLPTPSIRVGSEHETEEQTQETAVMVTVVPKVDDAVKQSNAFDTCVDQSIESEPSAETSTELPSQSGEDLAPKQHAYQAPVTRRRRTCFKVAPYQPHVPVIAVVQPETDVGGTEATAAAEAQPHEPETPVIQSEKEADAGTAEAAALTSDDGAAEAEALASDDGAAEAEALASDPPATETTAGTRKRGGYMHSHNESFETM